MRINRTRRGSALLDLLFALALISLGISAMFRLNETLRNVSLLLSNFSKPGLSAEALHFYRCELSTLQPELICTPPQASSNMELHVMLPL